MGKTISHQITPYSIPKHNLIEPGYSPVYISPIPCLSLPILQTSSRTLFDSFLHTVHHHPSSPFLGTRQYTSSGILGPYSFKSYSQIHQTIKIFVSGLKKLNLLSKSYKTFTILSKNREEAIITELSCMSQNIPVIPLPDNLTSEALAGILSESRPALVACGKAQCDLLVSLDPDCLISIKSLIVFDALRKPVKAQIRSIGIEVYEYQEVLRMEFEEVADNPPSAESLAWVLYTSGVSGNPRGVMLLHRNVVSAIVAIEQSGNLFYNTDSYLMYLPHSHVYDRIMTYILINSGSKIGFYSGDILNIKEDLLHLKPTIFVSVPRIFNRFYQIIKQRFSEKSGLTKLILKSSLKSKETKYNTTGSLKNSFWEKLAFKKVRKSVGNNVRLMVSASAPLNGEVLKFLRMVFACPIVECLGITETCGPCFLTESSDTVTNHVGGPLPGIEAKIRELPEMGFTFTNDQLSGELCLRGASVFAGYYKGQDVTDKAVDSDGWFYTRDIVTRDPANGAFKVIDRLSNIVKLSQGDFVSIEKVENVLILSQYVKQVFVYGDGFMHFLVAIVVPDKVFVKERMVSGGNGKSFGIEWSTAIRSSKVKGEILEDLKEVSVRNGLARAEIVADVYLEENEWTDQDILTNTQKLNRVKAKMKYKELIQLMSLE